MNTTDYKAAKLKEFDEKFKKLTAQGGFINGLIDYPNEIAIRAFISQTIDELDAQWRERRGEYA